MTAADLAGYRPRQRESICSDWLDRWPALAVVACGMVGSAQGWREAPYVNCPADALALATQGALHLGRQARHIGAQADAGGVSVLSALSGSHTISLPVVLNNDAAKLGDQEVQMFEELGIVTHIAHVSRAVAVRVEAGEWWGEH